jgi:hypothetical protein
MEVFMFWNCGNSNQTDVLWRRCSRFRSGGERGSIHRGAYAEFYASCEKQVNKEHATHLSMLGGAMGSSASSLGAV